MEIWTNEDEYFTEISAPSREDAVNKAIDDGLSRGYGEIEIVSIKEAS